MVVIDPIVAFCDGKNAITDDKRQERKGTQQAKTQTFVLSVFMVTALVIALVTPQSNLSPLTCSNNCKIFTDNLKKIPKNGTLRLMTWNLLLGHTYTGRDNTACVTKVIENLGADVAGLQESDPLSVFWGSEDVLG